MSSASSPAGPPAKGAIDVAKAEGGGRREAIDAVAQQPLVGEALQQSGHVAL